MPNTNASFSPVSRSDQFQALIEKLEAISHRTAPADALAEFDTEAEELLTSTFGAANRQIETYKYATLAEAATLVNLPEAAQEASAQDLPKKAIQQRRQVLEGCLTELQESEAKEVEVLTGEDHEDPPGLS
ncbi:MAG: hypothetical protein ACT4OO_06205 [Nitrospiraceae bacterium]